MSAVCQGCGGPLPPGARKWCSERCRNGRTHPTRGRPRDAARLDRIAAMWRAGRTGSEIAGDLGMTPKAVSEAVRRMRARGVDLPRRSPGRRPATHLNETAPAAVERPGATTTQRRN